MKRLHRKRRRFNAKRLNRLRQLEHRQEIKKHLTSIRLFEVARDYLSEVIQSERLRLRWLETEGYPKLISTPPRIGKLRRGRNPALLGLGHLDRILSRVGKKRRTRR